MSFLSGVFGSSSDSSGSGGSGGFLSNLGSVLTDFAGAAQTGLGIYNETQGGPPVNTNIGGTYTPAAVPGAAAPKTFLGFSITEIVIGVLVIVGAIFAIHYATK